MEKLVGIVEDIIYRNENNGYTIIAVSTDEGDKTCVGTMFQLSIGEEITVEGEYGSHPIYGVQFNVEQFTTNIPKDKHAFERYLGSGAIKGIGPVLAGKIVEVFGDDTFRVIEEEPERLEEVKGISMSKAQSIAEIFYNQRALRQAILFLQQYQISLTYSVKIYEFYKDKVYTIMQENPYRLSEDIYGIGFKLADNIAAKVGIERDHPHRIMAAITYVLNHSAQDGHIYIEKQRLEELTKDMLQVDIGYIDHILAELQMKQKILIEELDGQDIVYLAYYHQMEKYCSHKVCQIMVNEVQSLHNIERTISIVEQSQGIKLDEIQKEAIRYTSKYPFVVVTGGPGTGKTTTINTMIEVFKEEDLSVFLAAPTGRAAKRMTETTGYEATTIHRLLEINYNGDEERQSFERNEDYPLECDVLILDETSMLDINLFYHVLKAVPLGCRLVMVGDKDQLPSVGAGNVLRDLIASKHYIPTVVLKTIFRQDEKSAIVHNAHKIHQGIMIDYKDKEDFFFIQRHDAEKVLTEILGLVKSRLPKFTKLDYKEGIQVLTPMRKGALGVERLNIELQKVLNPPSKTKAEKVFRNSIFRAGDKVMQIRNNYSIEWKIYSQFNVLIDEGVGVFNGDIGTIDSINHYSETLKVRFDDLKQVTYEFTQLDELELAYSITVHKSQGSEYPIVVMPMFKGPSMLLSRNLLYTAITRAKQMVVLVGSKDVLSQMIANDKEIRRNSSLHRRIDEAADLYGVESTENIRFD